MKKNLWIIFAALTTSLLAQDASNTAPVLQAPPPAEPAPMVAPTAPSSEPAASTVEAPTNTAPTEAPKKKKSTRKKSSHRAIARKAAPELKSVPLIPGPAVVSANHVNVRSKAGLIGEVVTRMTNGEPVTVIEEVHLKKSGPEEPSAWAKIALPSDAHVWVKSSLLDANSAASHKVNLRAGPGENYGVLGILQKGETVQSIQTKGDWTEIQAPTNAYAFMAAQYLKQGEEVMAMNNMPPATPAPEQPAPAPEVAPEQPQVAPAPAEAPMAADTNAIPAPAVAPEMPETAPAVQEPPQPRIVEHEGIVRGVFSIQAPTKYEIVSPDTHQPVDFLYTSSTNLDLSRYKGMRIIVTGEESLDDRWKNTPVITIRGIKVLD